MDRIVSMEVVLHRQSLRRRLDRIRGSAGTDDFQLNFDVVLELSSPRKRRL